MKKSYCRKLLSVIFSSFLFMLSCSKNKAHGMITATLTGEAALLAGGASVLAGGTAAVLHGASKAPGLKSLFTPPPDPFASMSASVCEATRIGGSGKPLANNHRYNTREKGEQAARRAGGGKKPDFHPNPKDGCGPHSHPQGSHNHYYVPRSLTYTVRKGDTLSSIAAKHGTTVSDLAKRNGIPNPDKIFAEQVLKV